MANKLKQKSNKVTQKKIEQTIPVKTEKEMGIFPFRDSITKFYAITVSFLSHSAWQGISAIISLLSLIVTVVLTVYVALYIFNLGKEQDTANMYILGPIIGPKYDSIQKQDVSFIVLNRGPATGRNVNVVVTSEFDIECAETDSFNFSAENIKPTKIVNSPKRCDVYFENFYSNRSSYIVVYASTAENPHPSRPFVVIFGENVVEIKK
jgi:hypothetical protein